MSRIKLPSFWKKLIPKFVLGFLLISALATVGFFAKPEITALGNLSRYAFLLACVLPELQTELLSEQA